MQISVPATSANLCLGFDTLGLALELNNEFIINEAKEFSFHGFEAEYCNDNNLVKVAYEKVFSLANKPIIPISIEIKCNIPVSRGLGSSSSLIVAGVFAANQMLGNLYSKAELFNICVSLEGHPDNVAPAIYGGLVASYQNNGVYKIIKHPVAPNLIFTVVIPAEKIATSLARKALPKALPYPDIVNNLSRIVNLPKAFAYGDISLIKELFVDCLHEPYRLPLISISGEVKKIASELGAVFCVSGSGSTMLVISEDEHMALKLRGDNRQVLTLELSTGMKIKGE